MYGDTAGIRRRVMQLREQGVDIRMLADHLVGQVESIAWTGRAADSLRERIRERAAHLREAAGRHDAAADSLERHLGQVDTAKHDIATAERKYAGLLADKPAGDAAPAALSTDFTPPVAGHKDWLSSEIRGL